MPLPSGSGYATAPATNPSAELTDFTFMVDLSTMPAEWWAAVDTSDGTKGRAAKDSDATELAADWIDFDDVAETGWVRILWSDALATSGTQTVRIYPPQAANDSYAADDTFGSDNAYDANWEGYWPLHEDPTGSAPQHLDRTSNGNNGTSEGSPASHAGKVVGGVDYGGGTDATSLGAAPDGPLTLMAWSNQGNTVNAMSLSSRTTSTTQGYEFLAGIGSTAGALRARVGSSGGFPASSDATGLNDGAFHHAAMTVGSSNFAFLVDGAVVDATTAYTGTITSSQNLYIARRGSTYFVGQVSDVQRHSVVRSDAWIASEYAQTNDNEAFWTEWTWNAGGGNRRRRFFMAAA